ncbi:hypothetical protein D3C72_1753520 [compost metagenome]
MEPLQCLAPRTWHEALLPARMGDRIDGGQDFAAVLAGARGQRCVLAHVRRLVPHDHGLEHRVACFRAQRFADQVRERADEAFLQGRGRRFAACHGCAGLFDRKRERRGRAG